MKRILFLSILIIVALTELNAQEFGSWIVPPYRFDFYNNTGVVVNTGLMDPNLFTFSDGAFKNNGELLFYILDDGVYNANSTLIGQLGYSYGALISEAEIINVPGQLYKFYVIWGWVDMAGAELRYTLVDCTSGSPQITYNQLITPVHNEAAIAITELYNNIRYLYVAKYGGLYKYEINSNGISPIIGPDGTVVTSSDPTLNNSWYFAARNLEINYNESVLAWCAANFPNDLFIVYLNQGVYSSSHIKHLNNMEISGIEFADVNNNTILYASCEGITGGIQNINYLSPWQTGTPLTTNGSYGNTFLEKASDGKIYAVSNDGSNLGRINPESNTFVPSVVTNLNIKSSESYDGSFYKLPKDKTIYSPLSLELEQTYVSCPGYSDGTVTANPSGGTPPYTYLWTPGGSTTQTVTGLPEGWVIECCVTDSDPLGEPVCDEIEVTIDPAMFDYNNEYVFYNSTTYPNWNKKFKAGIRVMPGKSVVLQNCNLQFGTSAKIIVERGGKLTLDNCVLTNHVNCEDLWQGIEVWGNRYKSQYKEDMQYYQGTLIIKNGTYIENAMIGVLLSQYNEGGPGGGFNKDYDGGIIQIPNNGNREIPSANFINNRQSIVFKPYHNYFPGNPLNEVDNISYLYNCYFNINTNYFGGDWYHEHIHLYDVKGITIKGSTFENNKTATHNGHGINAYGAGFRVESLCNSPMAPCPDEYTDKSYFKKFGKAINLTNGGIYTLSVKNSIFEDNSNGIVLNIVNNAIILFNEFNIGYVASADEQACGDKGAGYGIDMTGCTGFAIEENEFTKAQGAPSGNYTGIRCKDSQTPYDIIYKNTFDGLSYANFAEGNNRSSSFDLVGLEFQCNTNTGNNTDFIVTGNDPNSPPQIRTFQGTQTLSAGNTFSTNALWHFKNDGGQVIDYFYHNYPPFYYTPNLVVPYLVTNENGCLSHYGGGGGGTGGRTQLTQTEIENREDAYEENLANYNNVNALYGNLKDGGNTEVLQVEIETSWPNDMWELRAELLDKSPHLSQDVLMTAADKTDVLPESILFEILSANPDELRKEELLKYLEDKEQPLPEYMIDILRQLAGGITYKTILQQQMTTYNAGKSMALYDLIRSNLSDTVSDMNDLRNRLANLQNINADDQIISTYLDEGNYSSAQSLLNMIPTLYGFQDDELINYNDYKAIVNMKISIEQQGRNMMGLDSTEVAALVYYAENSLGKAKYMAQGILNFGYGYNYCNCPAISDSLAWKSSGSVNNKPIIANGLAITATPNPAKTWVVFDYNLPVNTINAVIEITDITGRNVATLQVNSSLKQYVWDIRQVARGIYLYRINSGSLSEGGKLIIE